MHSTLTYFSFLSFSAAKVHHFCESCKYFAGKFTISLTFLFFSLFSFLSPLTSHLFLLAIPLLADFVAVHLVDQDLCQRRDGLKGNLPARIVAV